MSERKCVVIVGGGVIGLCCALEAARRGHRVSLVDRGPPGHDSCAAGSAGYVCPSHFVPLAAPGMVRLALRMMRDPESPFFMKSRLDPALLAWAWRFLRSCTAAHVERAAPVLRDLSLLSRKRYLELAAESNNVFALAEKGLLCLSKTEANWAEEKHTVERARSLGVPAESLTASDAARLEPSIAMEIAGAVYFPEDCHLAPRLLLDFLADAALRAGVTFRYGREVAAWRRTTARIDAVCTTDGDIAGEEFVLAGGSWSSKLARSLGLRLPMQAGKGYSLTVEKPRALPAIPLILNEARIAVTPIGSRLRFGGTMEIAGLDTGINPARVRGIVKNVPKFFPAFRPEDFAGTPAWTGLRPLSPDGLPYIGRTSRCENLIVATGHAMLGLSLGPVTGVLVAEIIGGEATSLSLELLKPDRYG